MAAKVGKSRASRLQRLLDKHGSEEFIEIVKADWGRLVSNQARWFDEGHLLDALTPNAIEMIRQTARDTNEIRLNIELGDFLDSAASNTEASRSSRLEGLLVDHSPAEFIEIVRRDWGRLVANQAGWLDEGSSIGILSPNAIEMIRQTARNTNEYRLQSELGDYLDSIVRSNW